MYDFTKFKSQIKEVEEWLKREFAGIRTGRATPTLLDAIKVESYGAFVALSQVGSVSVEDARSIRVIPWDLTQIKAVEKAIGMANLGVGVSIDDKGVRVTFPELTGERRTEIVKAAKEKLEQAKVNLRGHRDHVQKDIQVKEKAGGVGKDEVTRFKNELQKLVDAGNKALEESFAKKEKEILS